MSMILSRSKILLLLALLPTLLHGQAPGIQWQYNYGGSMLDAAHCVSPTSDGGFILSGYTDSNDGDVSGHFGQRDIWVVKLHSDGTLEWQRCYGGSLQEQNVAEIRETMAGGFVLAGTTSSFDGDVDCPGPSASRIWVTKLDPEGQIEWQRCLGGSGSDTFAAIHDGPDGYVLCGHTSSSDGDAVGNNGLSDLFVVKLDLDGNTVWSRCYGGSRNDVGRHVSATTDGGYVLSGQTQSNDGDLAGINPYYVLPAPVITGWVLRIDSDGEILWQRCVGGSSNDYIYNVQVAQDGSLWAGGHTYSNDGDVSDNHGGYDAWVIRLDGAGNVVGNRCFGGSGGDRFQDIHILPSGNAIAVGYTNSIDGDISAPLGNWDIWATCVTPDLELVWQRTLGGSAGDLGESVAPASDGGIVIAGYSLSDDGDLTNNNGYGDLWVVKLEPWDDTGLHENILENALELYPNPATDLLHIQWAQWRGWPMSWSIFDLTGREVAHGQAMGERSVVPLGDLATGTYLFQLRDGQGYHVKRFVKQ